MKQLIVPKSVKVSTGKGKKRTGSVLERNRFRRADCLSFPHEEQQVGQPPICGCLTQQDGCFRHHLSYPASPKNKLGVWRFETAHPTNHHWLSPALCSFQKSVHLLKWRASHLNVFCFPFCSFLFLFTSAQCLHQRLKNIPTPIYNRFLVNWTTSSIPLRVSNSLSSEVLPTQPLWLGINRQDEESLDCLSLLHLVHFCCLCRPCCR